ncbi:hypothetical protein [Paenibacillus sp. 1P03SA]|uniref:hypothetical protein n=1 Tax=Paenibacillus sp. 1P03SA TaxID=3132294 RepID=UPI00399FA0EB
MMYQEVRLNASAIMLLQKAAGVPIESIKKRFYRAMEDVGRIWEEFWKVKYNMERRVTVEDDDGNPVPMDFTGSNYRDVELNLKIDIGPSSSYSEELMMASLDKLFDGGHITLTDYLDFAPGNVIPFKDRLLKRIEQREMEAQMMQEQALASLTPEDRAAFDALPPEQQQQMLAQLQQAPPIQAPVPMGAGLT